MCCTDLRIRRLGVRVPPSAHISAGQSGDFGFSIRPAVVDQAARLLDRGHQGHPPNLESDHA
jgi:hypothetical protein